MKTTSLSSTIFQPFLRISYHAAGALPGFDRIIPRKWSLKEQLQFAVPENTCRFLQQDKQWIARVQSARLRSAILQHYARLGPNTDWRNLVETCGDYGWDAIRNEQRPIIMVTPHYGSFVFASLAIAQFLAPKRINIFYDDPKNNASNAQFFEILSSQANIRVLYNNPRGIATAVKALKHGEVLTMFPDVYGSIDQTSFVPFLDRYLRIMPGTAFLARRNQALVVPAYSWPRKKFGAYIQLDRPIDPLQFIDGDAEQQEFAINCEIFASISKKLREMPEYWHYWERLSEISQPSTTGHWQNRVQSRLLQVPALHRMLSHYSIKREEA